MIVSISLAALLGVLVIVLVKGGYVRLGSATACVLFGFTLAATGLAPAINNALASLAGLFSSL
ncbi:hypothetical protein ACIRU5_35800 [Streptomyces misionensis]|uniref:hypothetical protein n=1 Tax=Streptomyces misionensis TaxID=67331 RepID=UPI00382CBBF8